MQNRLWNGCLVRTQTILQPLVFLLCPPHHSTTSCLVFERPVLFCNYYLLSYCPFIVREPRLGPPELSIIARRSSRRIKRLSILAGFIIPDIVLLVIAQVD